MKKLSLSLSVLALVAGCAGPTTDSQPEQVGAAEQAVGEFACATTSISGTPALGAVITNPSWYCAFWDTAVSPDTTYSETTSGCTAQFVTEVQNVSGQAFSFVARPYPITTYMYNIDEATCDKLHVTLGAYGHKASGWVSIGTSTAHGVWQPPTGGFVGMCQIQTDAGSATNLSVNGTEGYDVVRAAASAYTVESYKGATYSSYIQVEAGIEGGGPC